jgi:hypothetical protein
MSTKNTRISVVYSNTLTKAQDSSSPKSSYTISVSSQAIWAVMDVADIFWRNNKLNLH